MITDRRHNPSFILRVGAALLAALAALAALIEAPQASAQAPGTVYVVSVPQAALYLSSDKTQKSSTVLARGRRLEAAGAEANGFIPVSTRGGARAWILVADVEPESPAGEYLEPVEPHAPLAPRRRPPAKERSRLGLEKLTFDLGGSAGSVNGLTYTEINLGLNAYFYDWLAWRNAVFARFPSGASTVYGLDSSVRGILSVGSLIGFTAFAGPGYRFVNQGGNVPFLEGGLVFKLAVVALGGGVKTLLYSSVQSGSPNDTQYFLILAGGGSL